MARITVAVLAATLLIGQAADKLGTKGSTINPAAILD